jgi:hypothetical protein
MNDFVREVARPPAEQMARFLPVFFRKIKKNGRAGNSRMHPPFFVIGTGAEVSFFIKSKATSLY